MLVCKQDEATKVLWSKDAIVCYLQYAEKHFDEDIGMEALKCMNNCLFQNSESCVTVCNSEECWEPLSNLLVKDGSLSNFSRLCIVSLYIFAGTFHKSDEMVTLFVECIVRRMSGVYESFEKNGNFTRHDIEALDRGFRLIYAIGINNVDSIVSLESKSKAYAASLPDDELLGMVQNMTINDSNVPVLDRIGFLAVRVFQAKILIEDKALCKELRQSALSVLMIACDKIRGFVAFLNRHHVVQSMFEFLQEETENILGETDDAGCTSVKSFKELYSIIITLTYAAQRDVEARQLLKSLVFPRSLPPVEPESYDDPAKAEQAIKDRQLSGDTPDDVFGHVLIKFMLCLDGNLKRFVSEFLYTLCEENGGEFVKRCGYGHAVHLLAIKSGEIHGIIEQQEKQS